MCGAAPGSAGHDAGHASRARPERGPRAPPRRWRNPHDAHQACPRCEGGRAAGGRGGDGPRLHGLGRHEREVRHEHVEADDLPHRLHQALPCVHGDVLRDVRVVRHHLPPAQARFLQVCVWCDTACRRRGRALHSRRAVDPALIVACRSVTGLRARRTPGARARRSARHPARRPRPPAAPGRPSACRREHGRRARSDARRAGTSPDEAMHEGMLNRCVCT